MISYLIREMAKKRQECPTSDGAVKITRKKWCRLGIENLSLKRLNTMTFSSQKYIFLQL